MQTSPQSFLEKAVSLQISDNLESKIRLLCNRFPHNEWSGTLFYIKLDNGIYEALDLCLMDIGSAGFTSYDESPDILDYRIQHPELLVDGVFEGLIHSHNSMAAFFSSTDEATIVRLGTNTNHFISLIVNNAGSYVAKMSNKRIYKLFDLDNNDMDISNSITTFAPCIIDKNIVEPSTDKDLIAKIDKLEAIRLKEEEEERIRLNRFNPYYNSWDLLSGHYNPHGLLDMEEEDNDIAEDAVNVSDKDLIEVMAFCMSFNAHSSILNKKQYDIIHSKQRELLNFLRAKDPVYKGIKDKDYYSLYDTITEDFVSTLTNPVLDRMLELLKKFPNCKSKMIMEGYIEDKKQWQY
jgi:hypothetical protein